MLIRFVTLAALAVVPPALAQTAPPARSTSDGEVLTRTTRRIPAVPEEHKARLRVGGDSAQRIALADFAWRGRVLSVEIDEQDARLFWEVRIEPDVPPRAMIRYRVDATNGGILGITEVAKAGRRRP